MMGRMGRMRIYRQGSPAMASTYMSLKK